jgi:two-component system NarL family sensor kinase
MTDSSQPVPATAAHDRDADLRQQLEQLGAQQQRLFMQLTSGEQHFRQLARSVWRVQEDERRRLARELHDGIGQHLTALRLRLDLVAGESVGNDRALQQAVELCDLAIAETRTLSRLLRPQILDDLGLEAALRWLARYVADGSNLAVEIDARGLPAHIDGDISTLVFRVAQEALTNVIKHAHATSAVVRLSVRGNDLQLLIVDDGSGCDIDAALVRSSQGQSTGLNSIRERVRLFGGRFAATSTPGEGLQLRILLPLQPPESSL